MIERPKALINFIEAARKAFGEHATDSRSRTSVAAIFDAIDSRQGDIVPQRFTLPVCHYLAGAAKGVREPQTVADLVDAFVALEPELSWRRRPTYDASTASDNFHDGHGNCTVLGPVGFERRNDVTVGVSLLAPDVRYPDHDHPPEETYLVASDGSFRQAEGNWFTPGVGGSFYNVPMIKHAMRSGKAPLLAFWALRMV